MSKKKGIREAMESTEVFEPMPLTKERLLGFLETLMNTKPRAMEISVRSVDEFLAIKMAYDRPHYNINVIMREELYQELKELGHIE